MRWLVVWMLAGCTPEQAIFELEEAGSLEVFASDISGPPIYIGLQVPGELVRGETAELVGLSAPANKTVALVASTDASTAAACPPQIAPECLELSDPFVVLGTSRSDAYGTAVFDVTLPVDFAPDQLSFQVVSVARRTVYMSHKVQLDVVDPGATPTPPPAGDPLDFAWDLTGDRPAGPHAHERGLSTAWRILESTVRTDFGPFCLDQTSDTWVDLFLPPDRPAPPVPDGWFYYVFFEVDDTDLIARNLDCSGPSDAYPDCPAGDIEYIIDPDEHTLTGVVDTITLSVPQSPGCEITAETVSFLRDDGTTGVEEVVVSFGTSGCPASLAQNDGCVVTHAYDLTFAASR